MGNHITVMDGDRKVIGSMINSLACFAVVNKIVEKYNGECLPVFGDVNAALATVYDKCEDYEEVQLLVFINDKSTFDKTDIPKLDRAIAEWTFGNDGPKKHLVFIRDLLGKHEKVITEYGYSTMAIAVGSE